MKKIVIMVIAVLVFANTAMADDTLSVLKNKNGVPYAKLVTMEGGDTHSYIFNSKKQVWEYTGSRIHLNNKDDEFIDINFQGQIIKRAIRVK